MEKEAVTEVWDWGPFLRRRWKSVAAVTVLTMAVTMGVTFLVPPSYESTAMLAIQPLTISDPFGFSSSAQLNARNIGELVKSPVVAERAAKALGKAKLTGGFEYRVPEYSGLVEIIALAGSPQDAAGEANAVAEALIAVNADALAANAKRIQAGLEAQMGSPLADQDDPR